MNHFTQTQALELALAHQVGDSHGQLVRAYAPEIHALCNAAAEQATRELRAKVEGLRKALEAVLNTVTARDKT